jgi:hypothetical protein
VFITQEDNFLLEDLKNASNQTLQLFPYEIITYLKRSAFPERINANVYPLVANLETQLFKQPSKAPDTKTLQQVALMPLFVTFYEKGRTHFEKTHGKPKTWPSESTWTFGRIIRNSFVHFDYKIVLDRGRPVKWKNIEYTKDSTRSRPKFIFNDLSVADIIFLMIDMNKEIS